MVKTEGQGQKNIPSDGEIMIHDNTDMKIVSAGVLAFLAIFVIGYYYKPKKIFRSLRRESSIVAAFKFK